MQKFYKTVSRIIEAITTPPPPPPPALIQRADDTKLTFDDILNFIKKHEGVKPHIYRDSLGIPTVGIGFNMLRPDARAIFHKHNLNYDGVLNGSINLSEDQMHSLFQTCLQIAYADVKHYIPSFDALPRNIKLGLIDLSFNLGYGRLSKFVKTREYILKGNYKQAAAELENSKWAKQVGKRSRDIISLFVAA